MEYRIHTENDHLCFNKKSTNQTFTFTNSKVIYCKKHLTCQVQHPQKTLVPLQLNVLYRRQTIMLVVEASLEICYLSVFKYTVKMDQSEASQNLLYIRK